MERPAGDAGKTVPPARRGQLMQCAAASAWDTDLEVLDVFLFSLFELEAPFLGQLPESADEVLDHCLLLLWCFVPDVNRETPVAYICHNIYGLVHLVHSVQLRKKKRVLSFCGYYYSEAPQKQIFNL